MECIGFGRIVAPCGSPLRVSLLPHIASVATAVVEPMMADMWWGLVGFSLRRWRLACRFTVQLPLGVASRKQHCLQLPGFTKQTCDAGGRNHGGRLVSYHRGLSHVVCPGRNTFLMALALRYCKICAAMTYVRLQSRRECFHHFLHFPC
jgi:hypothetical protein